MSRATARKRRAAPRLPAQLATAQLPHHDLVDDAAFEGLHYRGLDLTERAARVVDVAGCLFSDCRLAGSTLDRLGVTDSRFDRCDLANVRWEQAGLTRVELVGARLTGLAAGGVHLRSVLLQDCLADLSSFRFCTGVAVEFVDCRLRGADFVAADLSGAVFVRCNLSRAEFSQAALSGARFVDCVWDEVHGITSLAGATIAVTSPIDALPFAYELAAAMGIRVVDGADEDDLGPSAEAGEMRG